MNTGHYRCVFEIKGNWSFDLELQRYSMKFKTGMTLVEVMTAVALVLIIATGTMLYRYHSAVSTRLALMRTEAAQMALLFGESWKATGGTLVFDPVSDLTNFLTIQSVQGGSAPSGFSVYGNYEVVDEDNEYIVTLAYQDVDSNLRALNVSVYYEDQSQNLRELYAVTNYVK
jgi:prepilin-type N-terminal cleavage/methylation domain-containing protein